MANRPNAGTRPSTGTRPGVGSGSVAGSRPAAGARPSTRDVQDFLNLPNVGSGNVGGGRPSSGLGNMAAAAGGALAGGAAAEFLSIGLAMRFRAQAARLEIESMRDCRASLEIASMPVFPVSRGIEWMPVYRVNPEIESTPACLGSLGTVRILAGRGSQTSDRPGRPGDHVQNLPSRIADRGQWQNWRQENLGNVRDYWQNNWGNYGDWYGDSWWNNNHIDYPYYPGFGFWAGAAWSGLSGWGDYGWTEPIYYSYGDNVYYDDGSVYYGDQPVCTEEQYIDQAEAIALSVPDTKPAAKDWMPLGVFAITQDGEPTGADPTMYLQLALSKQGVINGTFQNTATNTVKAVEGMVDKQTQRAAWTVEGQSRPLMETGIANLTQDSGAVLVHFPDNTTQRALLVRLEKPGENKKQ